MSHSSHAAVDPALIAAFLPFDPFDPSFHADPYPVYEELRKAGPVIRTPGGALSVSGYDEVSAVLRDRRFGWGDGLFFADQFVPVEGGPPIRPFFLSDPPDHTRIRSLVSKAFAARVVSRLRTNADEITETLVADLRAGAARGPVDLMETLACPLPAKVLNDLLSVPKNHNDELFARWASDSARGLDPTFLLTPDEISARDAGRAAFSQYFAELAAERRIEPGDDLVSELAAAEEDGDRLTLVEMVTTCTTLLAAGYGTTAHLIGNGMLALLRHPEQLEWLREHPEQIPAAVDEMVRYDSPVRVTSRVALEPAEIGDVPVAPGETVFLLIGAANRDPSVYSDPDRLDLTRSGKTNLGFGLGIHYCIGAPVARLTAQAAFAALIQLDLRLASTVQPEYGPGLVIRGLTELQVTLDSTS
jgi:unspecific monooxygenase